MKLRLPVDFRQLKSEYWSMPLQMQLDDLADFNHLSGIHAFAIPTSKRQISTHSN